MSGTGQQPPGDSAADRDEGSSGGRAPGYGQRRAQARLALIEQQVTLAEALNALAEAAAHPAPPPGSRDPRAPARSRAERAAAQARDWIGKLTPVVGDPETVTDEHGRLPRDRREQTLGQFIAAISAEAASLDARLPVLRVSLAATPDRHERDAIKEELDQGTARLAYLRHLPPFTAGEMCSECPLPMAWHATGVTFCLNTGAVLREPCPSWPIWNAKIEAGLARFAEALRKQQPEPAPQPAPRPLAVIAAGSPVEDLITQLTQIQAAHPGAQVRRGRKGTWEIWPATPSQTTRGS